MDEKEVDIGGRMLKVETAIIQIGIVIEKMSAVMATVSAHITSLINTVSIIEKAINDYKTPSEYFI